MAARRVCDGKTVEAIDDEDAEQELLDDDAAIDDEREDWDDAVDVEQEVRCNDAVDDEEDEAVEGKMDGDPTDTRFAVLKLRRLAALFRRSLVLSEALADSQSAAKKEGKWEKAKLEVHQEAKNFESRNFVIECFLLLSSANEVERMILKFPPRSC